MRPAVAKLRDLGPIPAEDDDDTPDEAWDELQTLLDSIERPVSADEAEALCHLFGPDDGFGLNWTLVHLIESCADWPLERCLRGGGMWIDTLRRGLGNASAQKAAGANDPSGGGAATDRLHQVRLMMTEADAAEFDTLLAELAQRESLPWSSLWSIFDDDTEMHEVMWGLIHLVEGRDEYVTELVRGFDTMTNGAASEWAEILLRRALNDESSRLQLIAAAQQSPSNAASMLPMLEDFARSTRPLGGNARQVANALASRGD